MAHLDVGDVCLTWLEAINCPSEQRSNSTVLRLLPQGQTSRLVSQHFTAELKSLTYTLLSGIIIKGNDVAGAFLVFFCNTI